MTTSIITDILKQPDACTAGSKKTEKSFWHHIPQNLNLQEHHNEKLKFTLTFVCKKSQYNFEIHILYGLCWN